jgi:hypothetical protein
MKIKEWRWWDRIGTRYGNIGLEWPFSPDAKSRVYLNRVFLHWCQKPVYFFVPNSPRRLYDTSRISSLSKQIFKKLKEELSPFELMIKSGQSNEIPKHIKKKIKQIVTKVTTEILNKEVEVTNKLVSLTPGLTIAVSRELVGNNDEVKFPLNKAKLIGTIIVPDPDTRVVLANSDVTDYEEAISFDILSPATNKEGEVLSSTDEDGNINILVNVPIDKPLIVKWTVAGSEPCYSHKITVYYPDGKEESYVVWSK